MTMDNPRQPDQDPTQPMQPGSEGQTGGQPPHESYGRVGSDQTGGPGISGQNPGYTHAPEPAHGAEVPGNSSQPQWSQPSQGSPYWNPPYQEEPYGQSAYPGQPPQRPVQPQFQQPVQYPPYPYCPPVQYPPLQEYPGQPMPIPHPPTQPYQMPWGTAPFPSDQPGQYDPYGQGAYQPRPYEVGPTPHQKMTAALLSIFLGAFGVGNFYLGRTGEGIAQLLLTCIGFFFFFIGPMITFFWGLIEGILILSSSPGTYWHRDARGWELTD